MSFKKNKYTVLKGVINREMADFCFAYFLNKRKVARFLLIKNIYHPLLSTGEYGTMNKFLIHILIMEI